MNDGLGDYRVCLLLSTPFLTFLTVLTSELFLDHETGAKLSSIFSA
jgi:hypothetical protein